MHQIAQTEYISHVNTIKQWYLMINYSHCWVHKFSYIVKHIWLLICIVTMHISYTKAQTPHMATQYVDIRPLGVHYHLICVWYTHSQTSIPSHVQYPSPIISINAMHCTFSNQPNFTTHTTITCIEYVAMLKSRTCTT